MVVWYSKALFPKESLEFRVQNKVDELKTTSFTAFTTGQEIHEAHKDFARLVVTKLKALSQSGGGTLFPDPELNDIWRKIEVLTQSIKKRAESLRSSIVDLSHLINQTKDKYEGRHIRKKLWEWLLRFFECIANALGIVRQGISAAIGGAVIVGAAVGANRQSLIAAAGEVCKEIKGLSACGLLLSLQATNFLS